VDYEMLFVSQLPVIEKVIAQVCRQHHLCNTEAEEFASEIKLHLIERDYEVLRRFQQRSSLATYLTVVVQRQFLNYRNRLWGRWRPSAEATRLGSTAILMERLVARDGWSFDEAVEQMQTNYAVRESRDELNRLCVLLSPTSSVRRFVSEDEASDVPTLDPGPEANLVRAERDFVDRRVRVALEGAIRTLTAEERLLIKMRFDDAFAVSEIAELLHLKQRPLYRTFERLFARLRECLVTDGVSPDDVHKLFVNFHGGCDSDPRMAIDAAGVSARIAPVTFDRKREGTRG
jgi:RNA polymerase sigma factor (sigma-70 family)